MSVHTHATVLTQKVKREDDLILARHSGIREDAPKAADLLLVIPAGAGIEVTIFDFQ